jgi:CTP synthase (UTP-ammonia lyase)
MSGALRIALVGDYDPALVAHRAIDRAVTLAAGALGRELAGQWLATDASRFDPQLLEFDAIWCVPGSPYRNRDSVLRAIRFARERPLPFLGTCGGFQHALLEFARNVLGWSDAEHAETAPHAARAVVTPLACALVEARGAVHFAAGSKLLAAYGNPDAEEGYHCSYGLDPRLRDALTPGPLRVTAVDDAGEVRAVELDDHPFFVATLFQPERAALRDVLPPIVRGFVRAAA